MNKKGFHLNDNSLLYYSAFKMPAFSFWKDKASLIENTFNLFLPFGVELENIRTENEAESLGEEAVVIFLDDLGEFKLKRGNISWESEDTSQKDVGEIFEVIAYVNDNLPSVINGLECDGHFLEFGGHGSLESGLSFRDFMQQFHEPKLKSIRQNLPSGMMYNWIDEGTQRRFHFELDESLNVPGNVFLRWVVFFKEDKLNMQDFRDAFFIPLNNILTELGLEWKWEG